MEISDDSISKLKKRLHGLSDEAAQNLLRALEKDARIGARRVALSYRASVLRRQLESKRVCEMMVHEESLFERGYRSIAGTDEVGRGALAGPLVAAAVILKPGSTIFGIRDSKKLSAQARARLSAEIISQALVWGVAEVSNDDIDRLGLQPANLLALRLAVEQLKTTPDFVLSDGYSIRGLRVPSKAIIRGDSTSISIAAASIIAKVHRDKLMEAADGDHSEYGFKSNKGYGSRGHLEAIKAHGPCALHRRSFSPISDVERQASLDFDFDRGTNRTRA